MPRAGQGGGDGVGALAAGGGGDLVAAGSCQHVSGGAVLELAAEDRVLITQLPGHVAAQVIWYGSRRS
jgi:hypothetical protein